MAFVLPRMQVHCLLGRPACYVELMYAKTAEQRGGEQWQGAAAAAARGRCRWTAVQMAFCFAAEASPVRASCRGIVRCRDVFPREHCRWCEEELGAGKRLPPALVARGAHMPSDKLVQLSS